MHANGGIITRARDHGPRNIYCMKIRPQTLLFRRSFISDIFLEVKAETRIETLEVSPGMYLRKRDIEKRGLETTITSLDIHL